MARSSFARDFKEFIRISGMTHPLLSTVVGNPVEGERDSGLKPNTIPL
jgi:hypothetical protein